MKHEFQMRQVGVIRIERSLTVLAKDEDEAIENVRQGKDILEPTEWLPEYGGVASPLPEDWEALIEPDDRTGDQGIEVAEYPPDYDPEEE